MRRYRKWVLTLGIVAAAPSVGMAGPFSWLSRDKEQPNAAAHESSVNHNQKIADEIKKSLAAAKLKGTGISIQVQNGTATLVGHMRDPADRARAERLTARVPGVERVDNRMIVVPHTKPAQTAVASRNPLARLTAGRDDRNAAVPSAAPSATPSAPPSAAPTAVRQAAANGVSRGGIKQVAGEVAATSGNQQMAKNVADALTHAQLQGFGIQIDYSNGTARLSGTVSSDEQRARAEQAARQVSGVSEVENHLQVVAARPQGFAPQGFAPQGYGPQGFAPQGYGPQGAGPQGAGPQELTPEMQQYLAAQQYYAMQQYYQQQMLAQQQQLQGGAGVHPVNYQPNGPMGPPHPGGGPAPPMPHGHPGAGAPHTVYNNPQLPPYAWPSYAQYPNSAQVNYPTEYSASAWPYIGPFYPYPQVPLGWRNVQLQWDDGHWMLDFDGGKTNKWWWFMDPHNW